MSIESLDQLPEVAKKPFSVLCQLAYDGVMEGKIIFPSLPADVNTLSLLQGVESFIGREKAVSHNFIHLSIQELLAAWYIATQLPASEQVSKFNKLFCTSRFSAVFQYYSAVTKLKTPGIKDVVMNVVKKHQKETNIPKENQILMLSLLHCLYETQNPSLCEYVAQQLKQRLDLSYTTPTPSDCLCIGYFLAYVCKMAIGKFSVVINHCSIGDKGCKYLVNGLHKCLDTHSAVTTLLDIYMTGNDISHHGLHHLSTLLKISCIDFLNLSRNNLLSEQDTIHATIDTFTIDSDSDFLSKQNATMSVTFGTFCEQLKYTTLRELLLDGCGLTSQCTESLAEALTTNKHLEKLDITDNALCDDGIQHLAHALRVNQGLKTLYLNSCGLTSQCTESLAEALTTNKHLEKLDITDNALCDDGIQHLAHALRVNQGLKTLYLNSCGMTDVGLECLAKSLQHNNSLTELHVWNYSTNPNRITEKIVPVLTECLKNNYTLTELRLPRNLESSTTSIVEAVNDVRKRNGLPLIKVIGMYVPLNEDSMYM